MRNFHHIFIKLEYSSMKYFIQSFNLRMTFARKNSTFSKYLKFNSCEYKISYLRSLKNFYFRIYFSILHVTCRVELFDNKKKKHFKISMQIAFNYVSFCTVSFNERTYNYSKYSEELNDFHKGISSGDATDLLRCQKFKNI